MPNDKKEYVECSQCHAWYHPLCENIPEWAIIRQNGSGDVWNAEGSKSKSQTFINLFKNLKLFCKLLYIIK